jgi:hypothetical protein
MTRGRTYRLAIALSLFLMPFACRSDDTNAVEALRAFLDEFYLGRAQSNFTSVINKYTEWPDFAVGNVVQIATSQDLRVLREDGEEAAVEVRYKVIGEESLAKIEIVETEVVQTYRLRRRRGRWWILEPIFIPCVSVAGEMTRLRATIETASKRIAESDFSELTPREYFETLIANAQASIALLERHR